MASIHFHSMINIAFGILLIQNIRPLVCYAFSPVNYNNAQFQKSSYHSSSSYHRSAILTSSTNSMRTSLCMSSASSEQRQSLSKGDAVLLLGPGFLQLNIAKALKVAGLRPIVVAPQSKIESFRAFVRDEDIIRDATIGIPDPGEPFYGEIAGVVFCAEDPVIPPAMISTVIDWKDRNIFSDPKNGPQRVVACVPLSNGISKGKSMGWMPIFNNDKGDKSSWEKFTNAYLDHSVMKSSSGSLIYFGSLLGGSVDGPDVLDDLGLDECVYKMSLENYRDLKERSFDRYRLGAQVLNGDSINVKPPNQEKMEKEAIKSGEQLETFRVVAGYPEQDRSNRHTVAQAVVQSLIRPVSSSNPIDNGCVPTQMTVLSKCISSLPTDEEWDAMFANPAASSWPDPFAFDPAEYGYEVVA